MKHSTERILTTHAGSLARPADLLEMVRAKDAGASYDHDAFAARVRSAVAETVQRQIDCGIDVAVSDERARRCGSQPRLQRLLREGPSAGGQTIHMTGRTPRLWRLSPVGFEQTLIGQAHQKRIQRT